MTKPKPKAKSKLAVDSSTSHTPGPWRVERDESFGRYSVKAPGNLAVLSTHWAQKDVKDGPEALANARLAAAAPDLLEAGQALLNLFHSFDSWPPLNGYACRNMINDYKPRLQAAIDKAEGRTA